METIKEAWSQILEYLHNLPDISDVAYNTWITCIEPCTIEENTVILSVHTNFQRSIVEGQYAEKIKNAFREVLGISLELKILSKESETPAPVQTAAPVFPSAEVSYNLHIGLSRTHLLMWVSASDDLQNLYRQVLENILFYSNCLQGNQR